MVICFSAQIKWVDIKTSWIGKNYFLWHRKMRKKEHKSSVCVCLRPCPYLFPVILPVHRNNLYKTAASLSASLVFFFSQHTTCIMITTIGNITHPLCYIQTKRYFFSVRYKINVHIFWYFLCFFCRCSPKIKKKKNRCYLQIPQQQKKK